MAHAVLKPSVCDFLDLVNYSADLDLVMEEVPVGANDKIVGATLKDSGIRQKYDIVIPGIKRSDEEFVFNPNSEERIANGDTLIIMGANGFIAKFKQDVNK